MSPVALILFIFGADRLLSRGRPRALEPVSHWWLATRPRLVAWVRSAPLTYGYLAILIVTTWVLASTRAQLGNRLLLAQSTNLRQLAKDPVRVLISSAFWLSHTSSLLVWALLLSLVLAPMERRIGSWRTGIVFAIGHLGATLLTAAGLWTALRLDAVERSVVDAQDVGASYGLLAVAAAMTYVVVPRWRLAYAATLLGGVLLFAGASHSFTDFGHLFAALLGFACYALVRRRSSMRSIGPPAFTGIWRSAARRASQPRSRPTVPASSRGTRTGSALPRRSPAPPEESRREPQA